MTIFSNLKTKLLTGLILTAVLAAAQTKPEDPYAMSAVPKQEARTHHHKLLGAVMVVGGVALVGLGAFAFAQPCPKHDRADQISRQIGQYVTANSCGSSFLQKDKTAIGASALGTGAALVVSGALVMRK